MTAATGGVRDASQEVWGLISAPPQIPPWAAVTSAFQISIGKWDRGDENSSPPSLGVQCFYCGG